MSKDTRLTFSRLIFKKTSQNYSVQRKIKNNKRQKMQSQYNKQAKVAKRLQKFTES